MSTILPEVAPEHVAPAAVTEQTAPPVSPAVTDVTVTQPEPAPEPAATPAPAEPTDTNVSIAEPEQPAPVPDPTVTTTTTSTDTAAPLGTDSEPTAQHITPDARSNLIEQVGLLPRYEARSILTCAHIHLDLPKGRGGQRAPRSRAASLRGGAVTTKHREPYVPEQHHDGGHGRGCSGDRWERPGARQEAGEHLGVEIWPGMFQSSPPRPSSPSLSTSPVYGLSSIPVPIFPPLYAGEQLAGKEYTHGGRASRQCRYAERGDARIRRPMSVCGRCASVFDNRSLRDVSCSGFAWPPCLKEAYGLHLPCGEFVFGYALLICAPLNESHVHLALRRVAEEMQGVLCYRLRRASIRTAQVCFVPVLRAAFTWSGRAVVSLVWVFC